ncbi:MAG: hypothetical protein K5856_06120 [Bacteroidaceae bacterium]|nr:hypothetical protein [Bacteroidaceae bacterium]
MINHDTEHLKTNKQFMLGNGLLAFAVFIIVALFFYLSFREQGKKEEHRYAESYAISLVKGFVGNDMQILVNDSVLYNAPVQNEPLTFSITRFAESSSVIIVDNATDQMAVFELSEQGGVYNFEKKEGEVVLRD